MFETAPQPRIAPTDSSRETRDRLLEAAGEVFAASGFRHATVREICRRAGANVAAVNYHFGGKEQLYSEVLRYVDDRSTERHPHVAPGGASASSTPQERLRWFVRQFVAKVFDTGRPAWHERLMAREMIEPTHALDELIERNIRPRSIVLKSIVRELLGPGATDAMVARACASIVGQCLFYYHCRPMIGKLMPELGFDPSQIDSIADHIFTFSLSALEATRAGPARTPHPRGGHPMNFVALRMLMGDSAKYVGIIFGITFASLLMTQQMSIFFGLMARTKGFITDTNQVDIWVMDTKVQFVDDLKPISDTMLYRVRGVEGVEWAVPLYKGLLRARLDNGNFQTCNTIGIDDASLLGGPPEMISGKLEDLRRADSLIVDEVGANGKLAKQPPIDPVSGKPIGNPVPLAVGDYLELNDHRAVVVGVCRVSRTFQSNPVVYTTYGRATTFAPSERKLLSFVLVKSKPGVDTADLCRRIGASTGLAAYTSKEFGWLTIMYFMKYTGIPINFGIAVVLGFLVGTAIAGQTFYNFTLDNIKQFGALKAIGAGNLRLLGMILLQAVVVGVLGYGLGVGLASLFGTLTGKTELAFLLLWQTLVGTGAAVTLICLISALLSIQKVMRLEPAIVFKS